MMLKFHSMVVHISKPDRNKCEQSNVLPVELFIGTDRGV